MKIIVLYILFSVTIWANAQFGNGSDWHELYMADKDRVKHSRIWKITGLTLLTAGLFIGSSGINAQRMDVPLIMMGGVLTIEGIRLRHNTRYQIHKKR